MNNDSIEKLQEALKYSFNNKSILIEALTHPSFAYEAKEAGISDNSRLEFLGDSILGMVIAEYLYKNNPTFFEGELTRQRSLLVNRAALAKKAVKLGLGEYLRLGKGEEKTGGRGNHTNLAGALEAVIAAIYMDGNFEPAREFILRLLIEE